MERKIDTPEQVVAELRAMSAQFVHPKDTYFASMADVVERLIFKCKHNDEEANKCAAMRDALLNRLQWSNVNGGQAYILKGVGSHNLASVLCEAARAAGGGDE
jgi:hypothetical protein